MYIPPAFNETDLSALDALLQRFPFVTLITLDEDGTPCANQVPVIHRREGDGIVVEGHWARANPQSRHRGELLMLVQGPHHYISPGWYPDKETSARVPTWNYVAAQLRGVPEIYDDEARLGDLVARMSRHFEPTVGNDWRYEHDRDDHRRQLAGIIGFRFVPAKIAMKFKLNQNHPVANRASVVSSLDALGTEHAGAIAAMMRAGLPTD